MSALIAGFGYLFFGVGKKKVTTPHSNPLPAEDQPKGHPTSKDTPIFVDVTSTNITTCNTCAQKLRYPAEKNGVLKCPVCGSEHIV